MQKRLLFKIGYVCKIPWGGGGMTIWPTVYIIYTWDKLIPEKKKKKKTCSIIHSCRPTNVILETNLTGFLTSFIVQTCLTVSHTVEKPYNGIHTGYSSKYIPYWRPTLQYQSFCRPTCILQLLSCRRKTILYHLYWRQNLQHTVYPMLETKLICPTLQYLKLETNLSVYLIPTSISHAGDKPYSTLYIPY